MICCKTKYFECVIPEKNRNAFYYLIAGRDLFGYVLVRHWGRIGTKGQPKKRQRFVNEKDMFQEYERVHKERIKHHYEVVF